MCRAEGGGAFQKNPKGAKGCGQRDKGANLLDQDQGWPEDDAPVGALSKALPVEEDNSVFDKLWNWWMEESEASEGGLAPPDGEGLLSEWSSNRYNAKVPNKFSALEACIEHEAKQP